ncbi:MAG: DUF86 domain-containing protein [Bacteroidetes bacterium]|nr:DUF86 domain-containing protein [Bacteroidota bacterium]
MPDIERIKKHLSALLSDLKNLEKHKNITREDLAKDTDLLWILERGIYLSIQNLFDMMAHIASADFNLKWEQYSDIPELLFNENLINESERSLLVQMAGFRNRLSHDYLGLDLDILVDIVNNRIPDFRNFLKIIKDYCKI